MPTINNDEKGTGPLSKIIVALDDMEASQIHQFLELHHHRLSWVKIGMEAFYRDGRDLLREIHDKYGINIFLDLKLHDIPNTVAKAISALAKLPISFLTVHLSGGRNMLTAAVQEAKKSLPGTKLLGVTYLTSLGAADFNELWQFMPEGMRGHFGRLVDLAITTGMDGLILSPLELAWAKEVPLLKVCPGIRFKSEINGTGGASDQKRVATPEDALAGGADYLVMGRSITQAGAVLAEERLDELEKILKGKGP